MLASGSKGNCIYIAGGGTALLIDAGISARETLARLAAAGINHNSIRSILFTHDHSDHCKGARVLSRKLEAQLYANAQTADAIEHNDRALTEGFNIFDSCTPFEIGDLKIEPFAVPHDASDPVGFVMDDGRSRIGIVTDLGQATDLCVYKLLNCDLIVVESNHDLELLRTSNRAWSLIQRIEGRSGHLSNDDAAALIKAVATGRLRKIILAHLSQDCNTPRLARETTMTALHGIGLSSIPVVVASQHEAGELLTI